MQMMLLQSNSNANLYHHLVVMQVIVLANTGTEFSDSGSIFI